MKNLVKHVSLFMVMLFIIEASAAMAQSKKKKDKEEKTVEAYYFHNTRRCPTCLLLENNSKSALDEFYSEELKNGKVVFHSVNMEEAEGKEIAKRLQVNSMAFVVVSENEKTDLTREGLMHGKSNPDRYKAKIKETIDTYLGKK